MFWVASQKGAWVQFYRAKRISLGICWGAALTRVLNSNSIDPKDVNWAFWGGHLTRVPVECTFIETKFFFWETATKPKRYSIVWPRHSNSIIFYRVVISLWRGIFWIFLEYTPEITWAISIRLNTTYSLNYCFGLFEIARGSQWIISDRFWMVLVCSVCSLHSPVSSQHFPFFFSLGAVIEM